MTGPTRRWFKGRLKRLAPEVYKGRSYVHWTMAMGGRATGWLDADHHLKLRIILLHALARHRLCCPVYSLMPDHAHFCFIGLEARSEQLPAVAFLRREWNAALAPVTLQAQAYDDVLREADRKRDAFADLVGYIRRNPVRKGLVENWQDWPFTNACFPGYPHLNPRKVHFWTNFWKAYQVQGGNFL